MDNKHAIRVTWLLLVLVIILATVRIYLDLTNRDQIRQTTKSYIEEVVNEKINNIDNPHNGIDGQNGYTPQKNIDYFDGRNGTNGQDGANGKDGQNGTDGLNAYFETRCNAEKNRWEVKYSASDTWQVLNGEPTPCTITKDDIINALNGVL
jgi:hypothetical protein